MCWLLWICGSAWAEQTLRAPPPQLVDLTTVSGLRIHSRYSTTDNFTGHVLPGYGAHGAWFLPDAARALEKVQQDLAAKGLGLLIYDAYRPQRGTAAMVAWAKRTGQVHLLDAGYIARRSGHNHGHSVDLTVVDLNTGVPIDMGTPWDTFNVTSHTANAEGVVLTNRMILKDAMRAHGFSNYSKEWWHYRYAPAKNTQALDVPYGQCEDDTFVAPDGWSEAGWVVPDSPPFVPCP